MSKPARAITIATAILMSVGAVFASAASSGCGDSSSDGAGGGGGGGEVCGEDTTLAEEDLGTDAEDPEAGDFTLDEALDGLPEGPGPLRAIIDTEFGVITCEFFPEAAPIGVANFIGLARGRRPFFDEDAGHWIRGRRYYDGLIFHRVIDDFMAQGGDPLGTGFGGPGYEFDSEIADKSHVPGTLAYANAGPDTNGSQFYIVAETGADFLDGDYTIFGLCDPVSVVEAITEVETDGDDRPLEDIHMLSIEITRCAP